MAGNTKNPGNEAESQRKKGSALLPRRERLHVPVRIGFGIAVNVLLATWLALHLEHVGDPYHGKVGLAWLAVMLVAPVAALTILAPVVISGRDVPRILAIGLAFLPAYVAVLGFGEAFSLWQSG